MGGGALVFQGGYHPCKMKDIVLKDRQCMYVHPSGVQNVKKLNKGCGFGDGHKFFKKKGWWKIKKKHAKMCIQGLFFPMPGKQMFRVCFESPFTKIISNLKYMCAPPCNLFHDCMLSQNIMQQGWNVVKWELWICH